MKLHRPLIIANFKSHKTRDDMESWMDVYEQESLLTDLDIEVVLCPPMPSLMFVSNRLLDKTVRTYTSLGVQDLSPFPAGAYTGAVSATNLDGFNVKYALVGHSERRRYFHETHQEVANKVDQALAAGIQPIVCLDQPYIEEQVAALDASVLSKVIVAYEPLAAIGSGQFEAVDQVSLACDQIRQAFGPVPIVYGGSVAATNVADYLAITDGVLVGSHSLDAEKFGQLVRAGS